jgi:hypothetical protein
MQNSINPKVHNSLTHPCCILLDSIITAFWILPYLAFNLTSWLCCSQRIEISMLNIYHHIIMSLVTYLCTTNGFSTFPEAVMVMLKVKQFVEEVDVHTLTFLVLPDLCTVVLLTSEKKIQLIHVQNKIRV